MSIDLNKAVIELSLIPSALNFYCIYKNPNLHVTIAPANDVDLQGIRVSSEHAVIVLGYCLGGDGIECRVYSKGKLVHNQTFHSDNGDQRKANLTVITQILEGIRYYG